MIDFVNSAEFEILMQEIDRKAKILSSRTDKNQYPETYQSTSSILRSVMGLMQKHKLDDGLGKIGVDLGGGLGYVGHILAKLGYRAISIDYDSDATEVAKSYQEWYNHSPGSLEIVCGNYMPPKMKNDNSGIRQVVRSVDDFIVKRGRKNIWSMTNPGWQDPYAQAGIKFEDVDLFYSYPYDNEKLIAHMVGNYAKEGAHLLIIPVWNPIFELPENLKKIDEEWGLTHTKVHLYRKE